MPWCVGYEAPVSIAKGSMPAARALVKDQCELWEASRRRGRDALGVGPGKLTADSSGKSAESGAVPDGGYTSLELRPTVAEGATVTDADEARLTGPAATRRAEEASAAAPKPR